MVFPNAKKMAGKAKQDTARIEGNLAAGKIAEKPALGGLIPEDKWKKAKPFTRVK